MTIHLKRKARIALPKFKKAPVFVSTKYLDSANIFSEKLAIVLLENTKINVYTIELEEGKQPLYRLIYSLDLVKLEILKTYIKTNPVNSFIFF